MNKQRLAIRALCSLLALTLIFSIWATTQSSVMAGGRTGAWVDTVTVTANWSENIIPALQANTVDVAISFGISNNQLDVVDSDPNLTADYGRGLFYELFINPFGPEFTGTGKLNPFHVHKIREALNWLIDRDYIVNTILHGRALPKYFPISPGFPDYMRYQNQVTTLESKYAYDLEKARTTIAAEMNVLGATFVNNQWTYEGEVVTLIFIIRNDSDGNRIPIGDYIANQLEEIGFTVDRKYMKGSEASPIWIGADPAAGTWHLYTAAWSATAIARDQGPYFQEFYSPNSAQGIPALLANDPVAEFLQIADDLAYHKFSSWAERDAKFIRALELCMEDSLGIWIADNLQANVRRSTVTMDNDVARGLSRLWPYTLKLIGQEGGTIRFVEPDLFAEPWNPVEGSNWSFDRDIMAATADGGLLPNSINGLPMAQRIESASVIAEEGLPIEKSSNWVSVDYSQVINVPGDSWVDWDAATQTFITAAEKFPEGTNSLVKSVVTYPSDLFSTVKWHDGSQLDVSDFVMGMILIFDRAKTQSEIYDAEYEQYVFTPFMNSFKGVRIVSTQPLIIETYMDSWDLDAEMNVMTWWPEDDIDSWSENTSPNPWHTTTIGILAEGEGLLAFGLGKALNLEIEQTNYLFGPSLEILSSRLAVAQSNGFIPYVNTLGNYIDASETSTRWNNLSAWYAQHGHFWVGTGPFYLDSAHWGEKVAVLNRNPNYPDPAGKWDRFVPGYVSPFSVFLPLIKR